MNITWRKTHETSSFGTGTEPKQESEESEKSWCRHQNITWKPTKIKIETCLFSKYINININSHRRLKFKNKLPFWGKNIKNRNINALFITENANLHPLTHVTKIPAPPHNKCDKNGSTPPWCLTLSYMMLKTAYMLIILEMAHQYFHVLVKILLYPI